MDATLVQPQEERAGEPPQRVLKVDNFLAGEGAYQDDVSCAYSPTASFTHTAALGRSRLGTGAAAVVPQLPVDTPVEPLVLDPSFDYDHIDPATLVSKEQAWRSPQ
eukprot:TRINITY_DN4902_c0_g1_i1.p1 TRINITY_DN4902_c0_g1~~TRINITY_DN4902_c0_g1_i1.p1  ORF type:complete len:106 (+),score=33.13 TRINITY_DN4902_c0_g1_i1:257-574(+)